MDAEYAGTTAQSESGFAAVAFDVSAILRAFCVFRGL